MAKDPLKECLTKSDLPAILQLINAKQFHAIFCSSDNTERFPAHDVEQVNIDGETTIAIAFLSIDGAKNAQQCLYNQFAHALTTPRQQIDHWAHMFAGVAKSNPLSPYLHFLTTLKPSKSSCCAILKNALSCNDVKLSENIAQWVDISPTYQNQLGRQHSQLGKDMLIGQKQLDRRYTCELKLYVEWIDDYLPFTWQFRALTQLTAELIDNVDVRLTLHGRLKQRQYLGWTSFLEGGRKSNDLCVELGKIQ